jgi:uncharacterized protein (DUF4213/DUF364 family)
MFLNDWHRSRPTMKRDDHSSPPKSACKHPQEVARPKLRDQPGAERALLEALLAGINEPDAPIETVAAGGRFAAVRAAGRVGLASTLGAMPSPAELDLLHEIQGWPLHRAAGLLLDDSPIKASLGLAALNAGGAPPHETPPLSAGDLLQTLAKSKRVVVAGDFPFAQDLRAVASQLTVMDLRPGHGIDPGPEAQAALAECQVAAISSTALLTRSLAGLLEAAKHALTILVGPSTPWAPALFHMGADVLAGSMVIDPDAVLEAVARDLPFYEIKRRGVRLAVWQRPGLDLDI